MLSRRRKVNIRQFIVFITYYVRMTLSSAVRVYCCCDAASSQQLKRYRYVNLCVLYLALLPRTTHREKDRNKRIN